MQVDAGDTPFLHHSPGTHARASGSAIDRQQVDLSLGTALDGHGQLAQAVSTGFQGDAFEAQFAQTLDLGVESLLTYKTQSAVAFEFLDGAFLVCRLDY